MLRNSRAHTGDLFAHGLDSWASAPKLAFKSWMASGAKMDGEGPGFEGSSIGVYSSMWSKFVDALSESRGIDPTMATAADVERFLRQVALGARAQHRSRYALLLRRAFSAMAEAEGGSGRANPCDALGGPLEPIESNAPTPFLTVGERGRLFDALQSPSDFESEAGATQARSKALCALMAGAGMKPGQAIASSVNCVGPGPERFARAEALGPLRARRSLLNPRAWPALESWLAWRAKSGGSAMFPGARGAREKPMDYARAFVGVRGLLAELGIEGSGERASPQTLRNCYGADLLESGVGVETLCEYMGFSRLEYARRFARAHFAWQRRASTRPARTS